MASCQFLLDSSDYWVLIFYSPSLDNPESLSEILCSIYFICHHTYQYCFLFCHTQVLVLLENIPSMVGPHVTNALWGTTRMKRVNRSVRNVPCPTRPRQTQAPLISQTALMKVSVLDIYQGMPFVFILVYEVFTVVCISGQ